MEKTLADIEADIASLRANAEKYRRLAEARKAADHVMIAEKLMEYVSDLEEKAAELEALAKAKPAVS